MRCIDAAIVVVMALIVVESKTARGGIIRLDNSPGGFGERIDGLLMADLGTPAAGPILISGLEPLTVLVTDLVGIGLSTSVNSTMMGLGINSAGADEPARFDASFGEAVRFSFSRSVLVHQLDFRHFGGGEIFEFAGVSIEHEHLTDGRRDLFEFATPLAIEATTPFTIRAISGSIGIEAIVLELADQPAAQPNAAVPEPSTLVTFVSLGLSCLERRRRKKSAKIHPSVERYWKSQSEE